MAATDREAPADRIAVFEIAVLPGRASTMDWAVVFGSDGVLEAKRAGCNTVVAAAVGRNRFAGVRVGRRGARAVPV